MPPRAEAWPPWLAPGGGAAPSGAETRDVLSAAAAQRSGAAAAPPADVALSGSVCAGCGEQAEQPLRLRCQACRRAYFCSPACAEGAGARRHAEACAAAPHTLPAQHAYAVASVLDHLPLAALLASLSDAAYDEPPETLRVRCGGAGGDALQCSAAFAARAFPAGLLRVQLLRASGLPRHARALLLECADAEAEAPLLSCGGDGKAASAPQLLPLRDAGVDTLRVRVRGRGALAAWLPGGADVALGFAEVSLAALRDSRKRVVAVTTRGPGGGAHLRIALKLLPHADASEAAEKSASSPSESPSSRNAVGPPTERWSYVPLCFISHARSDTQAMLWRSRRGCTLALAFRGTQPGDVRDIATDLQMHQMQMQLGDLRDVAPPARFAFADGRREALAQARVHGGFQGAYASVRRRLRFALQAALSGPGAPTTLLVTGHSLGGALATLCAADVAETWAASDALAPPLGGRPIAPARLVLHTFGSPRVGDAAFAARLAALVPLSLRFVTGRDLVPSAPPLQLGYAHAGAGVHLPHADDDDEWCDGDDVASSSGPAELPGSDYERCPAEVAAAVASGDGVAHHLLASYQAALRRQLQLRDGGGGAIMAPPQEGPGRALRLSLRRLSRALSGSGSRVN